MKFYWGTVHGITSYKNSDHITNQPKILLWNFEFRQLVQAENKTFSTFCNRVEAAGKTYTFCECDSDCSAEEYAICDQIVIGTTNENIRKKAMIKNWKLAELCQKRMKYESSAAGEEKISGWHVDNTEEQEDSTEETTEMGTYQLNIWNILLSNNLPKFTAVKNDFKKNLLVNNCLVKILINTGAKVSVCGKHAAN